MTQTIHEQAVSVCNSNIQSSGSLDQDPIQQHQDCETNYTNASSTQQTKTNMIAECNKLLPTPQSTPDASQTQGPSLIDGEDPGNDNGGHTHLPTPPRRPSVLSATAGAPPPPPVPPRRPQPIQQNPNSTDVAPSAQQTAVQQSPSPATASADSNSSPVPTDDGGAAQTNADSDTSTCQQLQSQATQCCNNPTSCSSSLSSRDQNTYNLLKAQNQMGPTPGQSTADYCSQMATSSANAGQVNNGFASVCAGNQSSCRTTCTQLAQKYQTLLNNCSNCNQASLYQSTMDTLNASAATCGGLQAKSNAMASQGIGSGATTAFAQICQQSSSDQAGGGGGGGGAPSPSSIGAGTNSTNAPVTQPQSVTAAADPTSAKSASVLGPSESAGKAGFGDSAKPAGRPSFDVQSLTDKTLGATFHSTYDGQAQDQKASTIPNATGGAVPGSSSGGATAGLAAAGGRGPASVAAKSADILQGERSGGYSQSPGNSLIGSSGGGGSRGPASVRSGGLLGFDLRSYLPGGKRDPQRGIGGLNNLDKEINGRGEDLFKHVSDKFEEKCRLGELYNCND